MSAVVAIATLTCTVMSRGRAGAMKCPREISSVRYQCADVEPEEGVPASVQPPDNVEA